MTKEYKNFLFVEVPEDASRFEIVHGTSAGTHKGLMLRLFIRKGHRYISLPPGSWLIVGMSGQLGEEEAKGIVDHRYEYGNSKSKGVLITKDYVGGLSFATATESLASLIESMGMKNNCTLILKKK